MIALWITAALVATPPLAVDRIAEARHAIAVGRIDQAKAMTAEAVALGASGDQVDRLLADLAFVSDRPDQALARFEALMLKAPNEPALAERAGLAALRLRQTDKAATYLRRATTQHGATWRAWNGLAVAADRQGDFATADRAYATARDMAPDSAEVANNQGWSLLLRGRWQDAVAPLEQAAALNPSSTRIADNLELARSAQAVSLPERRAGESAADWAARLNDAGIVAGMQGNRKRAIAAFAQAIEARTEWFERAANNLAAMELGR
jgi:tetratricopeptide (TPR) repeat protein